MRCSVPICLFMATIALASPIHVSSGKSVSLLSSHQLKDIRSHSQAWRFNAFELSPKCHLFSNFGTAQPSKMLIPRAEEDRDAEVVYSDYADNKKRSQSLG